MEYLTGCNQYVVQPDVKEDGSPIDGRWFDEHRLEVVDPSVIALGASASRDPLHQHGADLPAPIK